MGRFVAFEDTGDELMERGVRCYGKYELCQLGGWRGGAAVTFVCDYSKQWQEQSWCSVSMLMH